MPTFEATKRGYANLFKKMRSSRAQMNAATKVAYDIAASRDNYERVERMTGVPWWWIGITHNLESGQDFTTHLHNGDPLTARTVQEPPGRPEKGQPPFSWDESAIDAIKLKELDQIKDWSIPRALYEFERYNGWGYMRYRGINSPYLWSFSNLYASGKYATDGKYRADLVSEQIGAAVLLRALMNERLVLMPEPEANEEDIMDEFRKEVEPLAFIAPTLVNVVAGGAINLAIKALAEAFSPEKVEPEPEAVTAKLKEATYTQIRDVAGKAEAKLKELFPVEPMPEPLPGDLQQAERSPVPEPKPTSKIDTVFGGEAFKGLKTVIGVIGWAGATIAGTLGYLDADTVTALQTAAGALIGVGLLAKIERAASWVVPIIRRFRGI